MYVYTNDTRGAHDVRCKYGLSIQKICNMHLKNI
jgi:hypothetical protein